MDRPDSVPFMVSSQGQHEALSMSGDGLYEARHINGPAGTYKGYKLLESEYPRDPMGRLKWGDTA